MIPKVVIAGTRTFNDYSTLEKMIGHVMSEINAKEIIVVSGGARGADSLGEEYASNKGYRIHQFNADWDTHGKAAGMIRNRLMAKHCDYCIVFWDGKSSGSKNMIGLAKEHRKPVFVYDYVNEEWLTV